MIHVRRLFVGLAIAALPLIGGCSSSTTSTPPAVTQALYVGGFGSGDVAEVAFPFSTTSTVTTSTPASLSGVQDLGVDSTGNIYVSTHTQVFVFARPITSSSTPVATINLPASADPLWIFVDPSNNLWVSDISNAKVYEFLPPFSGTITPAPNITLSTDIVLPAGLAMDPAGNLYVADDGTGDIEVFAAPLTNGETPNVAKLTGVGNVRDIAFDQSGNLYAGQLGGTIFRFNAPTAGGGAPSITNSSSGITGAYFFAFDAVGNLYVTDGITSNNVWEFSSVASTFSSTSTPAVTLPITSLPSDANGIIVGPK